MGLSSNEKVGEGFAIAKSNSNVSHFGRDLAARAGGGSSNKNQRIGKLANSPFPLSNTLELTSVIHDIIFQFDRCANIGNWENKNMNAFFFMVLRAPKIHIKTNKYFYQTQCWRCV